MDYKKRFKEIILGQEWFLDALRSVRGLDLPDWYIAAGAVRNTVWDALHNFSRTVLKDIDVVYFDSSDIEGLREKDSEAKLRKLNDSINWEVVNQARGHLFQQGYEKTRLPVSSSCESIAYWSETPTCVGVRLEKDDSLTICAPHGLTDLMELRVRPIPEPYRDLSLYKSRINEKRWEKKWPKLQIERII